MSDLDQPGPSGEAENAAEEVDAWNIIPNDPQTQCSFVKELKEKGYIFAKEMVGLLVIIIFVFACAVLDLNSRSLLCFNSCMQMFTTCILWHK